MYRVNKLYLVAHSPWPLLISFHLALGLFALVLQHSYLLFIGLILTITSMYKWLKEIYVESILEAGHSTLMNKMLYYGFLLFLLSEVLVFATLFSSYFYSAIIPSIGVYELLIPEGLIKVSPWGCPLLNTLVLYGSGLTITTFIHELAYNRKASRSRHMIFITLALAILFLYLQYYEYNNAQFTILDSIYGTLFYSLTGFHTLHVIVGLGFLTYTFIRYRTHSFRHTRHMGLTFSSLYWHFVDYVWVFLFIMVYVWPTV